jgi:hypothetical protein
MRRRLRSMPFRRNRRLVCAWRFNHSCTDDRDA